MTTHSPAHRRDSGRLSHRARRWLRGDVAAGLAFLAPFLAFYLAFILWPVFSAVRMSLFNWDLLGFTRSFVGLDNFTRMLWGSEMTWDLVQLWPWRLGLVLVLVWIIAQRRRRGQPLSRSWALVLVGGIGFTVLGFHPSPSGSWNDPVFWISVGNTVWFTVVSTPLLVVLGLVIAVALHHTGRGAAFYRAAFFLPYVLPISAVTLIWSYLLNPDRGLLTGPLRALGMEPVAWLSNPDLAMWGIILTTVWWSVGFNLVLFQAGLQDIDPGLYEAASLDGAGAWDKFRHITLPGLSQVSVLVVITQLIASFQIFGQVHIMTRGGPGTSTRVVIQHIYESGFRDMELGFAAALSLFLFIVMALVSAVQFRFMSSRES